MRLSTKRLELFFSVTFAKNKIDSKNKVKSNGGRRTDNCGIPKCIAQTKIQDQKIDDEYRNKGKVSFLNGENMILRSSYTFFV